MREKPLSWPSDFERKREEALLSRRGRVSYSRGDWRDCDREKDRKRLTRLGNTQQTTEEDNIYMRKRESTVSKVLATLRGGGDLDLKRIVCLGGEVNSSKI